MSIDVEQSLMDHEARYEYLSQLDEAWELCRLDVEHARAGYETALEMGRLTYEEKMASANSEHRRVADEAWAAYRQDVQSSGSQNRREAIAGARSKFNATVATNRGAYNSTISKVREEYSVALRSARADYEYAVEDTFGHHRAAVQMVHHYLDPGDHHSLDAEASDTMPMPAEDAHDRDEFSEGPARPDPHPATGIRHPGISASKADDDASFVDWLSGNGGSDHSGAAA